jgi:lambda family phage minor tail protein L
MTVRQEIASLKTLEIIEMFVFDASTVKGPKPDPAPLLRWHPGTTQDSQPIVWQGESYLPYPISSEGFETTSQGTLPRPHFRMSNIGGTIGEFLKGMGDGLGATITRKRTLSKYLDGQPDADPTAAFPDEIYYVARKISANPIEIVLEAAVAFDVQGVTLPRRQVIAGTCQWVYRGAECGYTGPPVQDINGNPTASLANDRCRKTLDACKARFGTNGILRTSAFPASLLVR